MTRKWFTMLTGIALLFSTIASCGGKKKSSYDDEDEDDDVEMTDEDDDEDTADDAAFPETKDSIGIDDRDGTLADDATLPSVTDDDIDIPEADDPYTEILVRRLTDDDLNGRSKGELEIMRNYIFARHGYRFKRDDLFNQFSSYAWYKPTTSDMATVYNELSEIEKENIENILRKEKEK